MGQYFSRKLASMTGMQANEWEQRLTVQLGKGIDKARHGKSDQWIADRTEQLGHHISRTAISEYRRGLRKTMPVTDWLVISAAIGVPPVSILFPGVPDAPVELLPVSDEPVAFDALRWVTGERQSFPEGIDVLLSVETGEMMGHATGRREYRSSLGDTPGMHDRYESNDYSPEYQALRLAREMHDLFMEYSNEGDEIWKMLQGESIPKDVREGIMEQYTKKIQERHAKLAELEEQIKQFGGEIADETITEYGGDNGVD